MQGAAMGPDTDAGAPASTGDFASRHVGPSAQDVTHMLAALGVGSLDELLDRAVPASIRHRDALALPEARTEAEVLARLRELADRNETYTSLLGMGYADTITPPVIQRNVLE